MSQFATADDLSLFLGREIEASEVARADLLLQLASSAIQAETAQVLEFVADDEVVLDATWASVLFLPQMPVSDVSSVVVENVCGVDDGTLATSEYRWNSTGLVWPITRPRWDGINATVTVTYSHGYEVIPDDLKTLCLTAAARAMTSPDGHSVQSESIDGAMSATYGPFPATGVLLTDGEMKIACRYRLVAVG